MQLAVMNGIKTEWRSSHEGRVLYRYYFYPIWFLQSVGNAISFYSANFKQWFEIWFSIQSIFSAHKSSAYIFSYLSSEKIWKSYTFAVDASFAAHEYRFFKWFQVIPFALHSKNICFSNLFRHNTRRLYVCVFAIRSSFLQHSTELHRI